MRINHLFLATALSTIWLAACSPQSETAPEPKAESTTEFIEVAVDEVV